jgi:hypothetical protein
MFRRIERRLKAQASSRDVPRRKLSRSLIFFARGPLSCVGTAMQFAATHTVISPDFFPVFRTTKNLLTVSVDGVFTSCVQPLFTTVGKRDRSPSMGSCVWHARIAD